MAEHGMVLLPKQDCADIVDVRSIGIIIARLRCIVHCQDVLTGDVMLFCGHNGLCLPIEKV